MSGLKFSREFLKVLYNKKIIEEINNNEEMSMSEFIEECLINYLNINLCEINDEKVNLRVSLYNDTDNKLYEDNIDLLFNNYVYAYLDPRKKLETPINLLIDGEIILFEYYPFYIGKGCGSRMFEHLRLDVNDKNIKKKEIIESLIDSGYEPIIKMVKNELTNNEAYNLENILITKLENLTNIAGGKSKNTKYKIDNYKSTLEYNKKKIIVDMLNDGKKIKDIAKFLNISERTVFRMKKNLRIVEI